MKYNPKPTIDRDPTKEELNRIKKMEGMLKVENLDSFPPKIQMARNLAKDSWRSLKAFIKGNRVLVTPGEAARRWDICEGCPFLKYDETNPETGKKDGRCVHCGCFMCVKVHFENSECPIKKW